MSSSKHLWIAIIGLVVVVALGGLLLLWPNYRQVATLDEQAAHLRKKCENSDGQIEVTSRLTAELEQATHRVDTEFKFVPETPDIAGLMRVLSMPVDGVTIRDQTFTAGQAKEAAPGSEVSTLAMPLTVDMAARFDSVFELILAAESMDRLLRVASVNIVAERQGEPDEPLVRASIGLEVIYEPPVVQGNR